MRSTPGRRDRDTVIDCLGIGRTQGWTLEPSAGTSHTPHFMIPCPEHPSRQGFPQTRSTRVGTAFHALTPATTHGPAPSKRQTVGGRLTYAGLESAAAWGKFVRTSVAERRAPEICDAPHVRTMCAVARCA